MQRLFRRPNNDGAETLRMVTRALRPAIQFLLPHDRLVAALDFNRELHHRRTWRLHGMGENTETKMTSFPKIHLLVASLVLMAGCQQFHGSTAFSRLEDRDAIAKLLPPNVHLDTVAECACVGGKKRTVEDELIRVKARVSKDGVLQDQSGKPIEFFHLTGCWGNPPANYQQILDEQNRRLEELRKTHTVITLTCNPSGMPVP